MCAITGEYFNGTYVVYLLLAKKIRPPGGCGFASEKPNTVCLRYLSGGHDLNDVKVVQTAVFGPLFKVNFRNGPFMEKVLTGAVFL